MGGTSLTGQTTQPSREIAWVGGGGGYSAVYAATLDEDDGVTVDEDEPSGFRVSGRLLVLTVSSWSSWRRGPRLRDCVGVSVRTNSPHLGVAGLERARGLVAWACQETPGGEDVHCQGVRSLAVPLGSASRRLWSS